VTEQCSNFDSVVSRKARLVFLDVMFCPFEFSSAKSFWNQIAIEHLRKFVLLPC